MADSWQVVSKKEYELGQELANRIWSDGITIADCKREIRRLPDSIDNSAINWLAYFAKDDEEISNNLITQVAYDISAKLCLNDDNGVVLTSNILAEDMVKISLIEWLSLNTEYSRNLIVDFVYGKQSKCASLRKICSQIKWYDPCVGGGVYPLSIIKVYQDLKIENIPVIYGYDINPLYIEATITRMSLSCGNEYREIFNTRIVCGDALDSQLNQLSLFMNPDNIVKYDIAIGNPPYVRGSAIEKKNRKKYADNYPELAGKNTDMYTYFICHALNSLSERGVMTFVTPAQFQMSNYGRPIRNVIAKEGELRVIADFNELPVFKNIGVHTSVYCISKKKTGKSFLRYEYQELPSIEPLKKLYFDGLEFPQENISMDGWIFSSPKAFTVLEFLQNKGIPLKNYSQGVFSGIKSGCKKAFFMKTRDMAGFKDDDWKYCKKMVLPKNIKPWRSKWSDDYLVVIKKGEKIDENSMIYKHMSIYEEILKERSDVIGHETWYDLRQCGYYDKFEKPKIIYPDISTECRFSMDNNSLYIPDGAFFIPGEDFYLLGILNSCIGRYYFKQKCARIGNPKLGGRIRFKKVYVEEFPVVDRQNDEQLAKKISALALEIHEGNADVFDNLKKIDELALEMYNVPQNMRTIIQEE